MAGCSACVEGIALPFPFSMAFQPIVNIVTREVFAYEALVRGPNGESAASVLTQLTTDNRYAFDQSCRIKAIQLASGLGLTGTTARLSINFLPGAVYRPETCIQATLKIAEELDFPLDRIIFEVTEGEKIDDHAHLAGIFAEYHRLGFSTAIDDFGAGYAGLNLLSEFQPDILKIDMALTRGINTNPVKRTIVESIMHVCEQLNILVVAEGIETKAELQLLSSLGIAHVQGFLLAKPGFESLPQPKLAELDGIH